MDCVAVLRCRNKCVCVAWVYMSEFVIWRCAVVRVVRTVEDLQHTAPKSSKGQVDPGSGRPQPPQAEILKASPQGGRAPGAEVGHQRYTWAAAPKHQWHRVKSRVLSPETLRTWTLRPLVQLKPGILSSWGSASTCSLAPQPPKPLTCRAGLSPLQQLELWGPR